MCFTLVRVYLEAAQPEIKQFNPGPAAVERYSGKDHQIRGLDGTMGQALNGRFREHLHHLKADAQNRVRRHRTVGPDPGIRGFTFQIFGDKNEVIMLDSYIKNTGEISIIQLLRHPRVFFESAAFHIINTGKSEMAQKNPLGKDARVREAFELSLDRIRSFEISPGGYSIVIASGDCVRETGAAATGSKKAAKTRTRYRYGMLVTPSRSDRGLASRDAADPRTSHAPRHRGRRAAIAWARRSRAAGDTDTRTSGACERPWDRSM